jgi:hypothetical protein
MDIEQRTVGNVVAGRRAMSCCKILFSPLVRDETPINSG